MIYPIYDRPYPTEGDHGIDFYEDCGYCKWTEILNDGKYGFDPDNVEDTAVEAWLREIISRSKQE